MLPRLSRASRRSGLAAALAAGAVICAGCSCLREARDDVALHLAVKRAQRQFLDPTCIPAGELCHYREGWREGYRDVATGLDGTPPVVPPKKYWNVSYVDPGCQHKIQLWYRGYADGALRAGRDGVQVGYFVPAVTSFDPPCNCQPRCASGCASGGMTEFETIELAPPSPPPIHEGEPLPSASLPGAELSTVPDSASELSVPWTPPTDPIRQAEFVETAPPVESPWQEPPLDVRSPWTSFGASADPPKSPPRSSTVSVLGSLIDASALDLVQPSSLAAADVPKLDPPALLPTMEVEEPRPQFDPARPVGAGAP